MATRGSEKERAAGGRDDIELTPGEQAASDQIAAGAQDQNGGYTRRDANQHAGYTHRYQAGNGGGNVYDNHAGYTRRFGGETRRDNNQHGGYTRRDANNHAGFTRRDIKNGEEEGDGKTSKKDRLKSLAANGLLNAEKKGDSGAQGSLYTGDGKGRSGWSRIGNWFQGKNRKKMVVGTTVGVGLVPLIALIIFLLLGLKIPHFIENMATWRFVRITNQYRKSATNVTGAKAGLEALSDAERAKAVQRYGKYSVFDGINRLQPNRVLASLQTADRLQYNYKTTITGKKQLVSITIAEGKDFRNKTTYKVPGGDRFNRFNRLIHPFKTRNEEKAIMDALSQAMKMHDPKIPTVTRSLATKNVIKKAGGSLRGLIASRYLGKSDRAARIAIQQDMYRSAKDSGGIAGITSEEQKKVAEEADKKTDEIVNDDKKLGDTVDKGGGLPDETLDIIENRTDPDRLSGLNSAFKTALGFANPVYDIAMPVCMMYDGSKITHEELDAQQKSTMREAFTMLSVGDQQKNGNAYNTPMAGALNWKAGDINDSMAMRRVSGKTANTTDGFGGQRTTLGTYGQYTVFDALTDGNGGSLNSIADKVCPVATNLWFGVGLALVNIGVVVASGGTAGAIEAGATTAAQKAITKGMKELIKRKLSALTLKKAFRVTVQSGGKTFRFAARYTADLAKWGAITAGAIFMARMIVMDKAGMLTNGLETSGAFLDNVDNGANHIANQIARANYRARPCTNVEIAQNWKRERQQIAQLQQEKGAFERYLALENPNSLVSRVGITTASLFERNTVSSAINGFATLFNPMGLSSRLFADANSQAVFAASNINTRDYGNVQWCYSAEEERLMDQDSYASPPENQKILEDSGKEQEINDSYAKCYDKSDGQLLEDGDIVRNEEGDVLNDGGCSPLQLGPHNPEYGDLVFRWRLKYNYLNTTSLLIGIADPQKGASNSGSGSVAIPTGTAQQLAAQILSNPNITFQSDYLVDNPDRSHQRNAMKRIAATGKATNCGGPAVDPKLLGVMLAMAQKYKIVVGVVVDGHDCNGGFHPKGQAFDLNGVVKLDGSAKTGDGYHITWAPSEQPLLREFYSFASNLLALAGGGGLGQIQCFNGQRPAKNPNVMQFSDSCDHLHVDIGTNR